jgi:hypothetical protein
MYGSLPVDMLDLDEIDFVESPVEKKILAPFFSIDFDGVYQTRLIRDTVLFPLYLAKTTPKNSLTSLTSDELVDPIATFFNRTLFYHNLFNQWMEWLEHGDDPGYVTKRTAIHLFAPIFVQELEGPHRYQLAALIDLCKSNQGDSVNWDDRLFKPDGEKKYFPSLQMETIDAVKSLQGTGDTDELNDAYDYLLNSLVFLSQHDNSGTDIDLKGTGTSITNLLGMSGHPNAGSVRNAIAHADYHIDFSSTNETPVIVYNVDGTEYELKSDKLLLFLNYQMTLLRALSAGITLAVFHANTISDKDESMEKLLRASDIADFSDFV